jgi:hypothetical protein
MFRDLASFVTSGMTAEPVTQPPQRSVWLRIGRGAKGGFRWSLGLCAVALVQAIAGHLRGAPPLPVVLAFYVTSGAFLGALTALLVPFMHHLLGAVGVCVLWAFILYSGAVLIMDGPGAYSPRDPLTLAGLVGGVAGFVLWRAIRSGEIPPAA